MVRHNTDLAILRATDLRLHQRHPLAHIDHLAVQPHLRPHGYGTDVGQVEVSRGPRRREAAGARQRQDQHRGEAVHHGGGCAAVQVAGEVTKRRHGGEQVGASCGGAGPGTTSRRLEAQVARLRGVVPCLVERQIISDTKHLGSGAM